MQEQFIVTVNLDGGFQIEAQGYSGAKGKQCKKDSAALEALLGTVVETTLKTEYYTATQSVQQQQFEV